MVFDFVELRIRLMGAGRIGQNKVVFAVLMLKEVVNPLLLHKPAHKIKVRFTVLYAVFPFTVAAGEPFLEVLLLMLLENFLDDVRYFFVLVDAAVCGSGQKPQPGHYCGTVACQPTRAWCLSKAADVTVEIAGLVFTKLQADGYVLADNFVRFNRRVFTGQLQVVLEQSAQLLGT